MKVSSISDVLGLDKTSYLDRRLQTIVLKNKIATTAKTARQMISHRRILVNGAVVDSPSYIVPISLEDKIELKKKIKSQ